MPTIKSGNLYQKVAFQPEARGWIIGHFINDDFFKTDDFEVKWAVHPKGDTKPGVLAESAAKTLVILIEGKFGISFPDLKKEIILSKAGDYLIYDAREAFHIAKALEDSVVLVIRWPSKRNKTKPGRPGKRNRA